MMNVRIDVSPSRGFVLGKAQLTELDIFRRIHQRPRITRSELAEQSGLSMAALTGIVNSLLARGLVIEEHDLEVKAGRRRVALSLSPSLGLLLGIDLGTYNLRIALINARGEVVAMRNDLSCIQEGRDAVIARCIASAKRMLSEHRIDTGQLLGTGVAFSGVINVKEGLVLSYPRTGQVHQWAERAIAIDL